MTDGTAADAPESGRIITFYSYKGGTGRSMALANAGWCLASAGHRVLLLDWDLEAPGLHRYLHPLLSDPHLIETDGLIDFLIRFATAAVAAGSLHEKPDARWFYDYARLSDWAVRVGYTFPSVGSKQGSLYLLPAGRQSRHYSTRVNTFDWDRFFTEFGGGVFLEVVKTDLRANFDFVLIDSRTGVSDTSGICTIQMPDDLVVCFTLNRQSLLGASAVARSAFEQRLEAGNALRVWPVPSRIEDAEKMARDRMLHQAKTAFAAMLEQVPVAERELYWGEVSVRYHAFYAYEEILAAFGDRAYETGTILESTKRLLGWLTNRTVIDFPALSERERMRMRSLFLTSERDASLVDNAAVDEASVVVCSEIIDFSDGLLEEVLADLEVELRMTTGRRWTVCRRDMALPHDQSWPERFRSTIAAADVLLAVLSPSFLRGRFAQLELDAAIGRPIVGLIWIPLGDIIPRALKALVPGKDLDEMIALGLRRLKQFANSRTAYRETIRILTDAILEKTQVNGGLATDSVRLRMIRLATEYINAGPGVCGEKAFLEMRRDGHSALLLLPDFLSDAKPASSLAAIAILQDMPSAEHIEWLAKQAATDAAANLGYQAAVALRMAVNAMPLGTLQAAVRTIGDLLDGLDPNDERRRPILEIALAEANERLFIDGSYASAFSRAFGGQSAGLGRDEALQAWNNLRQAIRSPERFAA